MLSLHLSNALKALIPQRFKVDQLTAGPLLFLHIPKTAGTSFRLSLEASLGSSNLLWDYGQNSPQTSRQVFDALYTPGKGTEQDKQQLVNDMASGQVLAGHLLYQKYKAQFPPERTITFIRHPVERVISNYRHAQRHQDFEGSLLEFAEKPSAINALKRHLRGAPWTLYGFIGVSEKYQQSLELFNRKYSLNLRSLNLNKAPEKQKLNTQPSPMELERLESLNKEDIRLYNDICHYFDLLNNKRELVIGGWSILPKQQRVVIFVEKNAGVPEVNAKTDQPLKVQAADKVKKNFYLTEPEKFNGFAVSLPEHTDPQSIALKVSIAGQPIFRV